MPAPAQENASIGQPLALLGIPFSNQDLACTVTECLQKILYNKREGKISYFSTIDGTLITKSYGWLPTTVDNPELLSHLRHNDITAISGSFLKTLGRCLGSTISPTFTTYEFLFALTQALSEKEKGVFILGGTEKETKNTAISLHDKFTKLRLVGIATPPLFTEGEDLINSNERDALLVEQINSSNADVLILNLGSTKQELWLERVRHLLTVPLIINVDHALEAINKISSKTSDQKNGDQQNSQETLIDLFKLSVLAFPLVCYHTVSRYLYQWFYAKKEPKNSLPKSQLFLSAHRSIVVLELPGVINSSNSQLLMQRFEEAASQDVLIFDFRNVRHIQPEGFYLLLKAWLQRNRLGKDIYGFGATADIECLMKLHHTWDLFKNTLCDSAETLMSRLKTQERTTFYDTFTQTDNLVIISLLGALDNKIDYDQYFKKLVPIIGQKNCCIDFSYCTFIDNAGFAFLLNLRKHILSQNHKLSLNAVNKALLKQFKTTAIDDFFVFKSSKCL